MASGGAIARKVRAPHGARTIGPPVATDKNWMKHSLTLAERRDRKDRSTTGRLHTYT